MHFSSCILASVLDKDKVKKVIDEVTCWVSSAEEGDSVVLRDMRGRKLVPFHPATSHLLPPHMN